MVLNQNTLKALEKVLALECSTIDEYLVVMKQEQEHVVRLQSDQVNQLSSVREKLSDSLAIVRQERLELTRLLNGNGKTTLSELITIHGTPADKKRVMPLINKLKAALTKLENQTKEFSQVVNFSLGLVNGSLSILWSATQTVTRCYNSFGSVTEMFQPVAPRAGSLLGRA